MEEEDWIDIPFPRKPIGPFKGPIRIASRPSKETQGKFTINIDPLLEILNRPNIANLPVAIFSVNGPIRCGKSFFLNQAIKYLKFGNSHPRNWIDQELETGFKWRCQLDSVTEGIEIWSEPFILTDEKNPQKKLALILMDNQGLEDATTDNTSTNKLFCLSNLLSSVFVYGDTKYRSKNFLENLHGFAQFSHSMERDSRGHDSTEPTLQFGTLILQCKDFQFYREFPCNGCEFYDKTSSQTMPQEKCLYTKFFCASDKVTEKVNRTKSAMTQMYNEILVCTMRGPGNSEPNDDEFYTSDSWDPQHLLGIRKFIKQVFTYAFLSKRRKQVFGTSLTAQQFSPFVENWAHSVVNNGYNIRIQTGLEYSRNAFYGGIISNSMAEYKLKLAEFKRNPSEGITSFHTKAISTIERELWTNVLYFEWRQHFLDIFHDKVRKLLVVQKVELEQIYKKANKPNGQMSSTVGTLGTVSTVAGAFGLDALIAGQVTALSVIGTVAVPVGVLAATGSSGWYLYYKYKSNKVNEELEQICSVDGNINDGDTQPLLQQEGIYMETFHGSAFSSPSRLSV